MTENPQRHICPYSIKDSTRPFQPCSILIRFSPINNRGDAGNRNPRKLSPTISSGFNQPFRHRVAFGINNQIHRLPYQCGARSVSCWLCRYRLARCLAKGSYGSNPVGHVFTGRIESAIDKRLLIRRTKTVFSGAPICITTSLETTAERTRHPATRRTGIIYRQVPSKSAQLIQLIHRRQEPVTFTSTQIGPGQ